MSEAPVTPPPDAPQPEATPLAAAPPRPWRGRKMAFIVGGFAFAAGVWLVAAVLPDLLTRQPDAPASASDGGPAAAARMIHATLFYVSDDGGSLVQSGHDVPYGATPAEQARLIVEAQVKAPPEGFTSAIPAGTVVHTVFLTASGTAYVDFSPELAARHSGGSLNEALTVYAIVNALTMNLPDITSVQILVDGRDVDTLAGHLDLRRPIGKTLAWVKKG